MDERGERYDRGDIERIFKGAVPEDVFEGLLTNPESIRPVGVEKEFAIFFCDIRGMTTYTEKLSPREGRDLVAACLEAAEAAIIGHGGFVDKFVGDEVMALFGAIGETDRRREALAACGAALAIRAAYSRIGVNFGLGINLGVSYVGNYGTRSRSLYTVFGDEINLAARLEGTNKLFRHDISVTESVAELVRA